MRTRQALKARWQSDAGRSVIGSLAASGSLQLLTIVSGVLVARSLGPEDRGYFALLLVVAVACGLLGNLGLPTAMTFYIARDPSQARRIVSSLARIRMAQLAGMLILQSAALFALVHGDPHQVKVAALISLLMPPGFLALDTGCSILQGQRRFAAFNILRILPTVAYVAGVLAAFLVVGADLVTVMALWAGTNLVGGLIAMIYALRGLPRHPEQDRAPTPKTMMGFGIKAVLGSFSPVDVVRLDQLVVGLFLSPIALGLYVVAQAFTQLPRVVAASVGMVAYPHIAAEQDAVAARRAMWRFFFVGLALSVMVVGCLEVLMDDLVPLFFGTEYKGAAPIAQILLIASIFMAARRVLTDGVNGIGRPGFGTTAEIASWLFLIPGLVIFLPPFGAEGVALALVLAWGASLLLLVALVLLDGRTILTPRLTGWFGGQTEYFRNFRRRGALTLTCVALISIVGGMTAVLQPTLALGMIVALSIGLVFALGRRRLAQHVNEVERQAPTHEVMPPDHRITNEREDDSAFATSRRLYYAGVFLLTLLTLRAGGQVTFSDLLFLFSFLFASAELVILRHRVPMRLPFLLLIGTAIFTIGGLLSTFESYEEIKSIAVIARLIFLTVFWFWLGTIVLRRRAHVLTAIKLWVISAAICAVGALLQLLAGNVIPGTSFEGGRATGFTTHPNDLGGITAIAFVPAVMLASRSNVGIRARVSSYAWLILTAAALIASGSIGALIAASLAFLVWLAFQRTSIQSIFVLATLATCVLSISTLQTIRGAPNPLDRLHSVTTDTYAPSGAAQLGSVEQRIGTYEVAIGRIKEDPFVGVGLDLFSVSHPFGQENYQYDVHNLIIGLWYKTGLVGLAGMVLALIAIFRSGIRTIARAASTSERDIAVALTSSMLAFVVFAMSEPVLFSRFGWIPAALILALRAVQQEDSVTLRSQRRGVVPMRTPGMMQHA
jgi:O-antigen/teichoic acid export membrane protein